MKISHVLLIFLSIARASLAYFLCYEIDTDEEDSCKTAVECTHSDHQSKLQSQVCNCKTIITRHRGNKIDLDMLETLYSENLDICEELVVNHRDLEVLDNNIFKTFTDITRLDLAHCRIYPNFSKEAEAVTKLDLRDNSIATLGEGLVHLKNLKILNLGFNHLSELGSSLSHLTLYEIYLNDNNLTYLNQNELGDEQQYKIVDLSSNRIKMIELKFFMRSLRKLDLSNNLLLSINKDRFAHLPSVEIVNLEGNLLDSLSGNYKMPLLKSIDLSKNKISKITEPLYVSSNVVETANFSENSIKKILCDDFDSIETTVKILDLSSNQITKILHCSLVRLKKLKTLNLAGNYLEEFPETLLNDLKELQNLNLSSNSLTKFDMDKIDANNRIQEIDLTRNKFVEDFAYQKLKEAFPNLLTLKIDFAESSGSCQKLNGLADYIAKENLMMPDLDIMRSQCSTDHLKLAVYGIVILVLFIIVLILILCFLRCCKKKRPKAVDIHINTIAVDRN